MAAHVMLSNFGARDIPDARAVNVVRDRDLESFRVQRIRDERGQRSATYEVYNRTCILGASRIVRGLDEVRQLIERVP